MGIFLDTGFFIALKNSRDIHHHAALNALAKMREKAYGQLYTSDYILDEAVTVAVSRTGRLDIVQDVGEFILHSTFIQMLKVSEADLVQAWKLMVDYFDRKLSFTDCTNLALIGTNQIQYLCTYDEMFNGLIAVITGEENLD
ncbi:MAG TPA: PIN domain-containing protein [Candidatus Lokiarchaeia archaeon]|nr:PIN domain-containing protein [Candidatus Lokiarchaeia archaeon]